MASKRYSGIYMPADIDILQRVFDQLCKERRLALKDSEQRERLAREVIDAFENGLTDETELWRALSKLRSARAG
ncbi:MULTISPECIES: RNA-binding protein [unclassified Mesorhizobium]|uniref:RNA-binding protein n=1 Tax=unclassified Mesorhizobium TaxID=325217 RepID=UPI0024160189|nr:MULTISPECIES: RNA-binding protein [unclassified Mesorhizobium]WFP65691.1 RNA-binding protein [Mesorhizobium sp. WSM4904]WFP78953.1 RNA-binding protein [Mesorhizobium sp. WSM4906]